MRRDVDIWSSNNNEKQTIQFIDELANKMVGIEEDVPKSGVEIT